MKQLFSLLRAVMSQDMSLFKYHVKDNSSVLKKILFPIVLALIFMYAIGTYYYIFGKELSNIGLTYIMLTIAMLVPTIFTVIEGIYKSQGLLFESRDNELLLSLPIKRSKIIFVKLFKFLAFQYLYNLLFLLPAFILYIYFDKPPISFYFISIVMSFLLPIIPTIISSFIGFFVKGISSSTESKKAVQTIFTLIIFLVIFILSFYSNTLITELIKNASSINDAISRIYYPIGAYIGLIKEFDFLEFIKLLLVNLLPLIIFIFVGGKYYFSIVSKFNESGNKNHVSKNISFRKTPKLKALVIKELRKYFSTPVYVFNTLFGVIIMFIAVVAMCINFEGTINTILSSQMSGININDIINFLPKVFLAIIVIISSMSIITSSSISIEGKSFNIIKSLPIDTRDILLSKILASDVILIPFFLISDIIFFIRFKVNFFDVVFILIVTFLMPTISAIIGLFANLKYPKMNASNDTEVIKQSMSPMVSMLLGLLFGILLIFIVIKLDKYIPLNIIIAFEVIFTILITIIAWAFLKKYGKSKIKEINV